ncbi:unnamed protein product, partial [Rotaria magnacalcarata]
PFGDSDENYNTEHLDAHTKLLATSGKSLILLNLADMIESDQYNAHSSCFLLVINDAVRGETYLPPNKTKFLRRSPIKNRNGRSPLNSIGLCSRCSFSDCFIIIIAVAAAASEPNSHENLIPI